MMFRFTLHYLLSTAAVSAQLLDNDGNTKSAFVPKKLAEKYNRHALNWKSKLASQRASESTPLESLKMSSEGAPLENQQDMPTGKELRNTSSKDDTSTTSFDMTFDASSELGILNRNNIHSKQKRELVDDFSLSECHGKHPKVSPIVNFQALVRRCLYYTDNCPYNSTLPIGCWDVSDVTDMSYAFYRMDKFNEPIGSWDTSSVTDLSDCFGFASSFNQPLANWNVGKVIDSSDMFWGAKSFNHPIGNWDVRNVQNMDYMFLDASSFNQPLDWKTDSLVDMKYQFAYSAFNQPLKLNTASVTDMTSLFARSAFNQPLDSFDTSSVTSMRNMFLGAAFFNQNIDSWDTRNVQDMTYMFFNAESFNQCLSTWAYKNPTTITGPNIFNGTSCPVQGIPDVISGPWCQGADDKCYPSSSGEINRSFGLASMVFFGAFLVPDIVASFFI